MSRECSLGKDEDVCTDSVETGTCLPRGWRCCAKARLDMGFYVNGPSKVDGEQSMCAAGSSGAGDALSLGTCAEQRWKNVTCEIWLKFCFRMSSLTSMTSV